MAHAGREHGQERLRRQLREGGVGAPHRLRGLPTPALDRGALLGAGGEVRCWAPGAIGDVLRPLTFFLLAAVAAYVVPLSGLSGMPVGGGDGCVDGARM